MERVESARPEALIASEISSAWLALSWSGRISPAIAMSLLAAARVLLSVDGPRMWARKMWAMEFCAPVVLGVRLLSVLLRA